MAKTKPLQASTNKTVSMKKADNGYVISSWDDRNGRDKVKIAKTVQEAKKIAMDMMS